jgi:hypothetical protein
MERDTRRDEMKTNCEAIGCCLTAKVEVEGKHYCEACGSWAKLSPEQKAKAMAEYEDDCERNLDAWIDAARVRGIFV